MAKNIIFYGGQHGKTRLTFGKPCKENHTWGATGNCLRYADRNGSPSSCVMCKHPTFRVGGNSRRQQEKSIANFWRQVNARGKDDCWGWIGRTDQYGRGQSCLRGKQQSAPRISYQITHGKIPHGLCVCHRCDNPNCVNPAHLWLGTQVENIADMDLKGRRGAAKGDNHPLRKDPSLIKRGEAKPRSKLRDSDVLAIRHMAGNKIRRIDIAKRFGVSKSLVNAIVWRHAWTHI